MPAAELQRLLGMRLSAEVGRLDDLMRIVAFAVAPEDHDRRVGITNRIHGRIEATRSMAGRSDEDWSVNSVAAADNDMLVNELIALLQTRLLRDRGLDLSTFDAAEKFLAELVDLAGISSLALSQTQKGEALDHNRGTVALRFPGARVWDLPILAHEYGHHITANLPHVEPGLRDRRPLEAEVLRASQLVNPETTEMSPHGHELTADALATIIMAETYPITCICLRIPFLPAASKSFESHPAWTERIAVMRAVLDALTDITGLFRYRSRREEVVDQLVADLLGTVPAASDVHREVAERLVQAVKRHRPDLIYNQADLDIQISECLERGDEAPPRAASVRSVLAGAWRWRLEHANWASHDDLHVRRVAEYIHRARSQEVA